MKLKTTEHAEQSAFVRAMALQFPKESELLFAIPNQRRPEQIGRYKAEGVKAGVPDMFLARSLTFFSGDMKDYLFHPGLFLEFKSEKGAVAPAQLDWHRRLDAEGYAVAVVRSAEEALETVKRYLKGEL